MKKRLLSKLLVLAMSVSLFSGVPQPVMAAGTDAGTATISGTLLDASGQPLADKTVVLRERNTNTAESRYTATTDAEGKYSKEVPAGVYQVRGYDNDAADTWENVSALAQVVTLDDGAQVEQDLQTPTPIEIPNGDLETDISDGKSWKNTSSAGAKWTNRSGDVLSGKGGFNIYNSNTAITVELNQTLTELENGTYVVTVKQQTGLDTGDELYLYAKNAEGEFLAKENFTDNDIKEEIGLVADVTDGTLTIGIAGKISKAKWSHVDDFRMGRLPDVETYTKAQLQILLTEAGTYQAADYTASSFAALTTAKAEAQTVYDKENATDKEITQAYQKLQAAIDGLVKLKKEGDPNIQNDVFWLDTDGNTIFSQGGGIFKFGDTYYWYGVKYEEAEKYVQNPKVSYSKDTFAGVTCYSSKDLVNWKNEGIVVTKDAVNNAEEMGEQKARWVGRLGVAKVGEKYALFVQHEFPETEQTDVTKTKDYPDEAKEGSGEFNGQYYSKQVLVLTSDSPTGQFTWNQRINMYDYTGGTSNTGDQTVFTDEETGKSYLVYSYGRGRGKMFLSEIVAQDDGKIGLDKSKSYKIYEGAGREGNCMFKYNGKYYVCASDLYGWNASHGYYLKLDSLEDSYLGGESFTPATSMKLMAGTSDDFCHVSQTGFFYTVNGSEQETVIFCGDRWAGFAGNGLGFNQWCPLSFDAAGEPYFNSLSAWDIDVATGEWTVHAQNNYVRNGSFDADRVDQTELAGWTNTINKGKSPINNNKETVTGKYALKLGDSADFDCKVSQQIVTADDANLPDGTYTLKAKVKNSGTFDELSMYAKSGSLTKKAMIKESHANYTEITLPDVIVSDNQAEIGFIAKGKANASALIDDVSFVLAEEQEAAAGEISGAITSNVAKNATLVLTSKDGSIVYTYELALKDGKENYTLGPVAAGEYKLAVTVHACTVTAEQDVTVAAGQTVNATEITVTNQGGNVTGKVVDDSGQNVAGVTVSLVKDGQEPIAVQTGVDGTYTIEDVLAGEYTIQVSKDGYAAPQQEQKVTIITGQTVTVPQIAMVKQVGTISGTVLDQSGNPVGGAKVVLRGCRTKDDDRRFTAKAGADGNYTIDVMAGSYQVMTAQEDASVQAVAEKVTVEINGSYTVDLKLPQAINVPGGDFESQSEFDSAWSNTGTRGKWTDRGADVISGSGGYNIWDGSVQFTVELNQTLTDLENGTYVVTVKQESGFAADDELYLYAKNAEGEILAQEDFPITGARETIGLVVEVTDRTLTIGLSGNLAGGAWSHVDDFCVGLVESDETPDSKAAMEVIKLINQIGKVTATDACKAKIDAAQAAYAQLTDAQKAFVTNYDVLTQAETKYEEELQKKEDKAKADAVIDLINSIGTVDASAECKAKIDAAKEAYSKLTDAQKALVKNFETLTQAETKYEQEVANASQKTKIDISKATVAAIPAQTYSGKALTPAVVVTYNGKTLANNTDYKLSYAGNVNIGTATVTITGIGNYEKSLTKTFAITVKKNGSYTVGSLKYKITNPKTDGKGTVAVAGGKSKTIKSAKIGATVKIGGKSFKITSIGKKAFKGYKKLSSVTIGKNVTKIEASAFEKCAKLKKIKISGNVLKSVGKNAIKGIYKKATIQCPKKKLAAYKKYFKSSTGYKKSMKIKK